MPPREHKAPRRFRPRGGHRRRPLYAAVLLALLLPAAACGGGADSQEPPALDPNTTPELRTYDPSPPVGDEPETTTIAQGTQGTIAGLTIGVVRARDGEAVFSVNDGPGIEEEITGRGSAGDTVDLDGGYTIAIDEVGEPTGDGPPGTGNGSVTLTVTPPGN
ncbi:hypothetical protein ACFOVU_05310 [Nocardiopsis sediminis]|uniref:Lipoprotein n=1 Tax=Nocardiopsis sediminis TaxID=1778267 RepID=A0ABV8FGV8_9ACTN